MGIYFHENQLSYPKSPRDSDVKKGRDLHYGFINIASARAADSIFFNSQFHLHNFLGEAAKFLEKFNDHSLKDCVSIIAEKASVIPVGLDLNLQARDFSQIFKKNKPVILWNHRWEYDKNPKLFFNTLYKLQERSVDFDLIVLGEDYSPPPTHFAEAKERLSQHIIHWGYAESQEKYISLLQSADILPVTSIQEFFGISVCEAIFHGCFPILPRRLSYRELIPQQHHKAVFYDSDEQLELKIEESIANPPSQKCIEELSNFILEFSWENIIERYDCAFEALKNLRT
jgi:glycosyltransferase involved in cell wall biosynthesis